MVTGVFHGVMLAVIHAGRKLLREPLIFVGWQGSMKPGSSQNRTPAPALFSVLKLTCDAARVRGKPIRNCSP